MCMSDMINHTGATPLAGPNCADWGPRFPDMSEPFDPDLRALALETACKMACAWSAAYTLACTARKWKPPRKRASTASGGRTPWA